jgi:CTP synthase
MAHGERFAGARRTPWAGPSSPSRARVVAVSAYVHPFFVGTQAHPEFRSRPTWAHPLFRAFVAAAVANAEARMLPL